LDAFRHDHDKRDYVAAHVLARMCLAEEWGRGVEDALPADRGGWSLSHARDMVVCAVLPEPTGSIGIDVERLDAVERLQKMPEAVSISARDRDADLVSAWVAKEAYLKSRGEGFSGPLGFGVLSQLTLTRDGVAEEWTTLRLRDARNGVDERVWLANVGPHRIAIVSASSAVPRLEERPLS
jgi:phosphopantetheinyl transferase